MQKFYKPIFVFEIFLVTFYSHLQAQILPHAVALAYAYMSGDGQHAFHTA
jgi:hypothetical protein